MSKTHLASLGRASFAFASFVVLFCAASGCDSCKKAKEEGDKVKKEVTAKLRSVDEAPPPADELAEIVIKDPEAVTKRTADGIGFGSEVGASPWETFVSQVKDENAQKGLRDVDPHGAMAIVATMKIMPNEKPHGAIAAKLKDPEVASVVLTAAAKGGNLKAWDSKVLDTQVYEIGNGGEIAVYGPYGIAADSRDAIEAVGKYVAWRASKGDGQSHDVSLRAPLDKIGPQLQSIAVAAWGALPAGTIPPALKSALDPMIGPFFQGVADMGALSMDLDSDGKILKTENHVAAKGSFSAWLSKYPSGGTSTMLTMPKADGVSLSRFPDDLAPVIYAAAQEGLSATPLSAADRADVLKQLQALGKSLGHEVDMSNKGSGPSSEFLLRFDVTDAAAAKTATASLVKTALKSIGKGGKSPAKSTPYKKFGAEGEDIELTAGPGLTFRLLWAVAGSHLFIGFSNGAAFSLVDAAIDPASTATFDSDAAAKAKIATFPTGGIVGASYGDTWSFSTHLIPGTMAPAPTTGTGTSWAYTTASASGLDGKGEIPLAFIGDTLRFILGVRATFGSAPPPY